MRRVSKGWLIVWEPGVRSETVLSFKAAQQRIVDVLNDGDAAWDTLVGLGGDES